MYFMVHINLHWTAKWWPMNQLKCDMTLHCDNNLRECKVRSTDTMCMGRNVHRHKIPMRWYGKNMSTFDGPHFGTFCIRKPCHRCISPLLWTHMFDPISVILRHTTPKKFASAMQVNAFTFWNKSRGIFHKANWETESLCTCALKESIRWDLKAHHHLHLPDGLKGWRIKYHPHRGTASQ